LECPKCGAAREPGREECSSCGIIFARWQGRAPRPTQPQVTPLPAEVAKPLPLWVIVVAATALVVFGALWIRHRRAAPQLTDTDILNEINNRGQQQRDRLKQERNSARAAQMRETMARTPRTAAASVTAGYPPGLSESSVRTMIEECGFFQERRSFDIPRRFARNESGSVMNRFPALGAAMRAQLVDFDPPLGPPPDPATPNDPITVRITPAAYSELEVMDRGGDTIQLGTGRRRLDSVWMTSTPSDVRATVAFTWNYEMSAGTKVAGDAADRSGTADFTKTDGGWKLGAANVGRRAVCP